MTRADGGEVLWKERRGGGDGVGEDKGRRREQHQHCTGVLGYVLRVWASPRCARAGGWVDALRPQRESVLTWIKRG